MKRHVPGLHSREQNGDLPLEGLFLVRVEWASYHWHSQRAFLQVPSGSSIGSCAISAMTWNCSPKIIWTKRRMVLQHQCDTEVSRHHIQHWP